MRAVKSALLQTLREIEVIIIIDGPDEETVKNLNGIRDSRLRVKILPAQVGPGEARNVGVKESRARWIAFLDDDDEWLPQKLEAQLQRAEHSSFLYPIIPCRFIARNESGDLIWPRRYPKSGEPLSEYLFCQTGIFGGEGFVAIPTIMTSKKLLELVNFRKDLFPHGDWEWFLHADRLEGVGVEFVKTDKPLAICYVEQERARMSNQTDWKYSLSWVQVNRNLFTRQAYTSFIMTQVSLHAARAREWRAFWSLPRKAFENRRPRLIDLLAHIVIWCIPFRMRKRWVIFYDQIKDFIRSVRIKGKR